MLRPRSHQIELLANTGRLKPTGDPDCGNAETQEMLDFFGRHNITADVEVIPIQKVNEA